MAMRGCSVIQPLLSSQIAHTVARMISPVRRAALLALACLLTTAAMAQSNAPDLTQQQDYTMHKVSSSSPYGNNDDFLKLQPLDTQTLLDVDGPGTISHMWFTINSP